MEQAKWLLRSRGERLQAQVDLVRLPLACSARVHPWRTVALGIGVGLLVGRLDEWSHGRLHRLAASAARPVLRTLVARVGLTRR